MARSEDEFYYKFCTSAEICHSEINCPETHIWSTWKTFSFPILTPLTSILKFKLVCILLHITERNSFLFLLPLRSQEIKSSIFKQLLKEEPAHLRRLTFKWLNKSMTYILNEHVTQSRLLIFISWKFSD